MSTASGKASAESADVASVTGGMTSVTEGKATIYFPSEKGVFYNPPQIPNRDLSVLALAQFAKTWEAEKAEKAAVKADKVAKAKARAIEEGGEGAAAPAWAAEPAAEAPTGFRVLDAMTASGLRAIRYSLEVPQVTQVSGARLEDPRRQPARLTSQTAPGPAAEG